jgi:hypothetical protein
MLNERHRGQRPGHRGKVPGIGLSTTFNYLRRAAEAAAGSGLDNAIKYLVNQNAGTDNNRAKANYIRLSANYAVPYCGLAAFAVNSEPHIEHFPSFMCVLTSGEYIPRQGHETAF